MNNNKNKNESRNRSFIPNRAMMLMEKPKNPKKTIARLFKYLGSFKYIFILLVIFASIVSLIALFNPYLQGMALDLITINKDRTSIDWEKLLLLIYTMLALCITTAIFTYFQTIFAAKLSQATVMKMRSDLFNHIVKLPISYIDTHRHGDITSRMTNDIDKISSTVSSSIASFISGLLTIIGILGIMIYLNWFLAIVSSCSIFITLFVVKRLSKVMRKHFKKQQSLLGELNGHTEEVVTGYKTVCAYSQEEEVKNKFNKTSKSLKTVGIKAQIWSGLMGPVMNLINNFSFLLVCGFGGYIAASGSSLGSWKAEGIVTVGLLATFILYSKRFSRPINELANLWAQIASSIAACERVFEILDFEVEKDEGKETINKVTGRIEFNNVTFGYVEDSIVLDNFSIDIKPGQKIAIVGATGSGKTTIVNLLMRFYDPNSGVITIDGVDINTIPKHELRNLIAIVLQDTVLFKTTIEDNIKYGKPDATYQEMVNASKLSKADNFIEKLKNKYQTELTESASLSLGEQQLLSITRAILKDPKILILDEATSSVDTRTEKHIQDALVNLMKNRTSLIIAHRLSTIQDADVIIVIDKGVVVEKGNHLELLDKKGKYYNLYQTQFAGIQT